MRLDDPNLPSSLSPLLITRLSDYLSRIKLQLNQLTEGNITAVTNAYTAAPTTGKYSQGDFVKNSQPTELGSGGSMYIIHGWQCVSSGEPGTWKECRFLTGN